MENYSQNDEQNIILSYFGDKKGTLLDIGANDGKTFSNSLALIKSGWDAVLVEPHPVAFSLLNELHKGNDKVMTFNVAISDKDGDIVLHTNEPHIEGDTGLLSTIVPEEKNRWGLAFFEEMVKAYSWKTFSDVVEKKYDFITIDAEGMDYTILTQIDLSDTSMVCVEFNSKEMDRYVTYCSKFGLKLHGVNPENLIFAR